MHCMRVHLPLQQKENKELRDRLSAVENLQNTERGRQSKEIENLRRSEHEARAKAEALPSLLEQLSFLQHELENTRKEKENLEEHKTAYMEQTQQVGNADMFLHVFPLVLPSSYCTFVLYIHSIYDGLNMLFVPSSLLNVSLRLYYGEQGWNIAVCFVFVYSLLSIKSEEDISWGVIK